jgi:hypothetical protein
MGTRCVPSGTATKRILVVKLRPDARACIREAPKVDGVDPGPDGGLAPGTLDHRQGVGSGDACGTVGYLDAGPCQSGQAVRTSSPPIIVRA